MRGEEIVVVAGLDDAHRAAVLDALPDAVIVADRDGIIRDASASTMAILGWVPADLVGQPVSVLVGAGLVAAHERGFDRWARTGEPSLFGRVLGVAARHHDGGEVEVELMLGSLPDGHVVATIRRASTPAVLDAHETTRDLLAVLSQSAPFGELADALLASLADRLGYDVAGLWLLTIEQRRLRCAAMHNGLGPDADLFVSQSLTTALPKGVGVPGRIWAEPATVEIADLQLDHNFPRRAGADVAGLRSAVAFPVLADGALIGVIELLSRTPATDHTAAVAVFAEIGQHLGGFLRQRFDDELRRIDAERLRLAIDSAGMGVWRWDKVTGEVVWDEAMEALFGLDPGTFDGRYETYVSMLHPDDRDLVLETVDQAAARQEMYETLHRVLRPDGRECWLASSGRPLRNDEGETVGLIGISRDVTRRQRAQSAADRLVALVESSTDAVIGTTPLGVITSWNTGATALLGYPAEEMIGRPLHELVPPRRHPELDLTLDLVARGVSAPSADTAWVAGDGSLVDLAVVMSPVIDPHGRVTAISVIARDDRSRKDRDRRREREAEQSRQLAAIGQLFASAVLPDDVLDALVQVGVRHLGAVSAVVGVVDQEGTRLEVVRHAPEGVATVIAPDAGSGDAGGSDVQAGDRSEVAADEGFDHVAAADHLAFGDAAVVGAHVDLRSSNPMAQAVRGRHVIAGEPARVRTGAARVVAVPLIGEGAPSGALLLRFGEPVDLDADHQRFLLAVASRGANALDRSRLFAAEHAARDASERAAQRLAVLSRAGDLFASRNEVEQIAEALADLLTDSVADWCHVGVEGPDRGQTDLTYVPPVGDGPAIARAASRLAEQASAGTARQINDVAEHGDDLPLMAELVAAGAKSVLALPVMARGQTLGAVVLGTLRPRGMDDNDLALARELVRRSATAIDNARLVHHLRRLAASFQRNLLPRHLPQIDGLELGARYEAAGYGTDIGGDFYDVFPLDERRWVVVIGDVCGQGADAAGVTALARHTLRAVVPMSGSLTAALTRVNRTLIDHDIDDRFITIALAVVEVTASGASVRMAQAGHPDPIVVRADGRTEAVSASRGTLLGVREHPVFAETTVRLDPGDSLVFYTDGVTEISDGIDQFGEERLRALLAETPTVSASQLAGRVLEGALAFHADESTDDDMAVLTIRIPSGGAASGSSGSSHGEDVGIVPEVLPQLHEQPAQHP